MSFTLIGEVLMDEKKKYSAADWIIRPSTLAFIREGKKTPGYTFFDWLHGYVYARWPYLYIGLGTGEHRLARKYKSLSNRLDQILPKRLDGRSQKRHVASLSAGTPTNTTADGYHGKVVTLEAARQLVTVDEPVRLENLEQVIPYTRARDIVLQNPDHIIALECPCRTSRENPCLPLDVCLIIGEPFASFIAEHEPRRSRWITSAEAVEILSAEDERGHVHHAFFKDAMLGRFYAICNCCDCCCGAMQAQRNGTPMLVNSGYVCRVDEDLCIDCGTCHEYCQFDALSEDGYVTVVNVEKCMGCGVCVSKCDQGAISLERDQTRGEPLEIQTLMDQVV
jgi:Pyruvate/2-oxoacid:ferredoxin oxidoreductase delta subunit